MDVDAALPFGHGGTQDRRSVLSAVWRLATIAGLGHSLEVLRLFHLLGASRLFRSPKLPTVPAVTTSPIPAAEPLTPWNFDIDGDGHVTSADRHLIEASLGSRRSDGQGPQLRHDFRCDTLGRGLVDTADLRAFDRTKEALGDRLELPSRPIVIAWHYSWYSPQRRQQERQTVRYAGGNYASDDPAIEEEFNLLKTEFGITADMLSWINRPRLLKNLKRGYLQAANRKQRKFGLLYESVINLGAEGRIDFSPQQPHAHRLVADFAAMGRILATRRGALKTGVFKLGGRPVIYLFASHLWGTNHSNLKAVGATLSRARQAFADATGSFPYLIGDELMFPTDAAISPDRLYRATYFDAVTRYHHYDAGLVRRLGRGGALRMGAAYRREVLTFERRTMEALAQVRNRFTDAPLLIVPSSAAGFAKPGLPFLLASGEDYRAMLHDMLSLSMEHIQAQHMRRLGKNTLPAPLIFVGSWNEEFEGHALMPSAYNQAVADRGRDGLDWLHAVRSIYGWNHYSGDERMREGNAEVSILP